MKITKHHSDKHSKPIQKLKRSKNGKVKSKNESKSQQISLIDNRHQTLQQQKLSKAIQLTRTPCEGDYTNFLKSGSRISDSDTDTRLTIDENYKKSYQRGTKLRVEGLKWLLGTENAEKPIATKTTEDSISKAGYKDFWFFRDDHVTILTHRGKDVENETSEEVDEYYVNDSLCDEMDFYYNNDYYFDSGEIHASCNWKDRDNQENESPAPPNSEILWHQQNLAKAKVKEAGYDGNISTVKSITRNEISNTQTLDTIWLCDEGNTEAKKTITKPSDDLFALLGTPNGNSAVYLLMQHGKEFRGTDIESVSFKPNWLEIKYVTKE